MNIVHLLSPAAAGGLERVVQGLSIGQHARGHRVVIGAVTETPLRDHPFLEPLLRHGIDVRELSVKPRRYFNERAQVADLCRSVEPDVVHFHGYRPQVLDGDVVRRLGIATVATNHGFTGGSWRNRLYEWLCVRALTRFDAVIAVSKPMAESLARAGIDAKRIHVVRNAWIEIAQPMIRADARTALGLSANRAMLGWVGRMSQEKGLDVFVDAMSQLPEDVFACAIGDGPERTTQELRARALLRNGDDRLHWAGRQAEAGRFARAFDVFVLSSRTEGIPIVLLEAIAAGTPIVATRVGGVPDILSEREAWLVPSDDPTALAAAIRSALADPGERMRRVAAAQQRLEREMGSGEWLDSHERVYRAAQANRAAARSSSDGG